MNQLLRNIFSRISFDDALILIMDYYVFISLIFN